MLKSIIFGLWAGSLLSGAALADEVRIPVGSQGEGHQQLERPVNGMNKQQVEAIFGSPESRDAAVGEPPISRWHYGNYVVYFEKDLVLHSVLLHSKAP